METPAQNRVESETMRFKPGSTAQPEDSNDSHCDVLSPAGISSGNAPQRVETECAVYIQNAPREVYYWLLGCCHSAGYIVCRKSLFSSAPSQHHFHTFSYFIKKSLLLLYATTTTLLLLTLDTFASTITFSLFNLKPFNLYTCKRRI